MILTLDVGNTHITGGVFDDNNLVLQFRHKTRMGSSSDEFGIFFRAVLRENGINPESIKRIGICSVVPSVNYSLSSACSKYLGVEPLFIKAGIKTGLKLKYANPKEIGADRIAGAIGAATLHPDTNLIIIDMGTATTIDCVTKNKEYLGGAILPGLKMSMEALANGTEKLTAVEISRPEHVCGTSTTEAIQSGLFYGNAGALKEICYLYKKNIFKGQDTYIISTGGFSRILEDYGLYDENCQELVLLGIKQALTLNNQVN